MRYVRFVSAARPDEMPGWYASRRVFPYYEALTLAEATNELAFVATGIYGHALPPQHGAPLRLVLPWKYGFAANVDPTETNPWPQSQETMLGTSERRPTQPFNGYGEWVASLYPAR